MIRASRHFGLSSVFLDARFDVALEDSELGRGERVVHHSFHDVPQVIVELSILTNRPKAVDEIWGVFLVGLLDSAFHMGSKPVLPQLLLNRERFG